ncbi:MAG: hypothetical protein LQ338_003784 [Usnochroma carphineum]|nr:MAG: hypothetical protein LQ338_003784 [Usnochroma carphineum]
MAGMAQDADIEAKASRYLDGPRNHTGTGYLNEQVRNPIQNCAEVVCLNGPPGVDRKRIRNRLVLNLNLHYVSPRMAYQEEFDDPDTPYPKYLYSRTINNPRLPDKMKVELLGKYLERRVLKGERRFLIDGFPETERMAAIFEEDVCLIRAYIYVDGSRDTKTSQAASTEFVTDQQPVCDKLEAGRRFFKVDMRKPRREQDADIADIEATICSIGYQATLMTAGDVFRSPPPPMISLREALVPPPPTDTAPVEAVSKPGQSASS